MEEPRIVISISKEAVVKTEAFGFTGSTCLKPLELIANALGSTTTSEPKQEFFASEEQQVFA